MEFQPSDPERVGVELELQLVDAGTLDLVDGILPLMEFYPDSPHVKPEFIQNTVEVASRPCRSVDELADHVLALVADLRRRCAELGMALCGAGTHPFCERLALITPTPRYLAMEKEAGLLAHAQITFALHVHLGQPSGEAALDLMRRLRPCLPLLIALSANSPFWRGYDTGYAGYRQRILAATRSYGVPPSFDDWNQFVEFFAGLHQAGVFETINDIHWDIRPRPVLGTLEVRVMDMQATVHEALALAAFVRCLARLLAQQEALPPCLPPRLPWWIEKENHFQASRRGLAAPFIWTREGAVRPMRRVLEEVLDAVAAVARPAERPWLDRVARLMEHPGYRGQREVYRRTGSLQQVVARLVQALAEEAGAGNLRAGP